MDPTPKAKMLAPTVRRPGMIGLAAVMLAFSLGCATRSTQVAFTCDVIAKSPRPKAARLADAIKLAERYVADHPGAEYLIGRGGSMLPLYSDRTVLIVEPIPASQLQRGMSVVFADRDGWYTAHLIVEETAQGWLAHGLGNCNDDDILVTAANLRGRVVLAYEVISGEASLSGGQ